jgi:hypothetical protein
MTSSPSLPLELYQVLEEEYVSMYGPLQRLSPLYSAGDILDLQRVRDILRECGLLPDPDSESDPSNRDEVQRAEAFAALSRLVTGDGPLAPLKESRAITERGQHLIDQYDEFRKAADDDGDPVPLTAAQILALRREMRRAVVDDAFTGAVKTQADLRLGNVYAALHLRAHAGKPRTALCISGGGIRSATFALGILQGLASAKILDGFDYLSTVSGGGYIGSWLSSWMRRHPRGAAGVQDDLKRSDTAVATSLPAKPIGAADSIPQLRDLPQRTICPEPEPLRHLRAYSNYLSPKLGILSGDSWTMASLYLRNLLLNLLVLVPLLAFSLAFPRIFSWVLHWAIDVHPAAFGEAVDPWAWVTVALIGLGFAYLGQTRPVVQGERAQRKAFTFTTDGRLILFGILPLALGAGALAVYWARLNAFSSTGSLIANERISQPAGWSLVGVMTVLPFLLYYRRFLFTARLPAEQRQTFAFAGERRTAHWKKFGWELLAVLVAVATSVALFWLLAVKVFDDPMRTVPLVATLPPVLRAGLPASPQAQLYTCFVVPLILLVFFVQASLFVGLSSFRNEDYDREWWGRAGAWLLAIAVGLALLNTLAVFGPIAFYYAPVILASVGGGAGLAAALLGFSGATPANQRQKEEGGTPAKVANLATAIAVPLFVVALLAAISLGSTWILQRFQPDAKVPTGLPVTVPKPPDKLELLRPEEYAQAAQVQSKLSQPEIGAAGLTLVTRPEPRVSLPALRSVAHLQTIEQTSLGQVLGFLGVAFVGLALSFGIGVNKFSMHALYRNRLIRAYLGASRLFRDPDLFTGFDENDNLKMWELRPEFLWPTSLCDVEGLRDALKAPLSPRGTPLWNALEPGTQKALERERIDLVSAQALSENLNALLVTEDLTTCLGVSAPEWTATSDRQIGYPRALINRAILDAHFGEWITPMTPPADAAPAPGKALRRGPLHVVNTALNLTSGENLAWQQRMAESFTVSPHHTGSLFVGYRPSRDYGGEISLGTSVAISGAAASPNMGYHSSPLMAFLLTFFNIRLGAWLGNPGPHGQKVYTKKHPTSGLMPLVEELTGNSTDRSKWVYLSDGGHFENLGLYEMVVRRCHKIVLSDGGADPDYAFEDLGNAIRKIRTDLGIPIDIAKITMSPRAADRKPVTGEYVAVATIRYSAVDPGAVDGKLVYIKPGVYKGHYFPWDVYNYSQESLEFPHEPTSDQFFSESQFESYRALGRHAFHVVCKNYPPGTPPPPPITKTYTSVGEFVDSV